MKYTVQMVSEARARIVEQARDIAESAQAPMNAARWLERALDAAETLGSMPRRHPLAPEAALLGIEVRELSVDGFMLLFVVDDARSAVVVLSARHERQLPRPENLTPRSSSDPNG